MSAVRRVLRPMAPAVCMAVLVGALPAGAGAPSILDFDDWMQQVDDGSQDLQRHLAARDSKAATAAARELEKLYGLMEEFFGKRRESAAAVGYSREGREFARSALRDLAAGKFVAARRSALALARGCRDCHDEFKPL